MKTYNEMADDIFRRRDEYRIKQKKQKKAAVGAISSFMCLCLVAAAGFYSLSNENTSSNINAETSVSAENNIIINKAEIITDNNSRKLNLNLYEADFISMNKSDLTKYYGTDVFPDVPKDLYDHEKGLGYGIYKNNKGVYWDQNVINYYNSDTTRSINIELCRNKLPFSDYGNLDNNNTKSIINRIPVNIGLLSEKMYMAEFIYKNVGFRIVFEGLSQEEMISVITSIIKL